MPSRHLDALQQPGFPTGSIGISLLDSAGVLNAGDEVVVAAVYLGGVFDLVAFGKELGEGSSLAHRPLEHERGGRSATLGGRIQGRVTDVARVSIREVREVAVRDRNGGAGGSG